jgi:hypothetical protein
VKTVIYPFLLLSALGFVLSLVSHIAAVLGRQGPLGESSWLLHVGIFVVWIPTVLISQRITRNANQRDFWKVAFRGAPTWMRYSFYGVGIYAVANFLLFIATDSSHQHTSGAGMPPSVVRGFSGHWLAFYGAAFVILYSAAHITNWNPTCPNGHKISPLANFCEECGARIPPEEGAAV